MQKFCAPNKIDESWSFWRYYLDQFDNGRKVIAELETTYVELMQEAPDTLCHHIVKKNVGHIGHHYMYNWENKFQVDKMERDILVDIGKSNVQCIHYQDFTTWLKTKDHYMHVYKIFNEVKSLNFSDGIDKTCPILETIESFLLETEDNGFVVKGYSIRNHYRIFDTTKFPQEQRNDNFFAFMANDNVILHVTRFSGSSNMNRNLETALLNVHLAEVLHPQLIDSNTIHVNVFIYNDQDDSAQPPFCKKCIANDLFISESFFRDHFKSWFENCITNSKEFQTLRKRLPLDKSVSNQLYATLKKDIITCEALQTNTLPTFTEFGDQQIDEIKKVFFLTKAQFKIFHLSYKHMFIVGGYGCGKSSILIKKFEQILEKRDTCNDVFYFLCHEQQAEILQDMKNKYKHRDIIICKHNEVNSVLLPSILQRLKRLWEGKNRKVHLLIDEFRGMFITERQVDKIEQFLSFFEESYLIVSLQAMETNLAFRETKVLAEPGYQYDLLSRKTSIKVFYLDHNLRCSVEINRFVNSSADIIETSESPSSKDLSFFADTDIFCIFNENDKAKKSTLVSFHSELYSQFKFRRPSESAHNIECGPVCVYYLYSSSEAMFSPNKDRIADQVGKTVESKTTLIWAIHVLFKHIFENEGNYERFVICSFDNSWYDAAIVVLVNCFLNWTTDFKVFQNDADNMKILLTHDLPIRGLEFANFILLMPMDNHNFNYRVIECFTRATTKLHLLIDPSNVEKESINHQLIKNWRQLDCVRFFNCHYKCDHDELSFTCLDNGERVLFNKREPESRRSDFVLNIMKNFYLLTYPRNALWDSLDLGKDRYQKETELLKDDKIEPFSNFIETENIKAHKDLFYLIYCGAIFGSTNILKHLLEVYKVNINTQNSTGNTALHLAVQRAHQETVKVLLEKGADLTIKNIKDQTAKDIAFCCINPEMAELLSRENLPTEDVE